MKTTVTKVFECKNSHRLYQVGDVYEGTQTRLKELNGFVVASSDVTEPVVEKTTKKNRKKSGE